MTTARPPQPRVGRHRTGAAAAHASFDDAAVERLLRGDWVDGPVAARLARIFDAAAAPATPDELRHADAVLAAYALQTRKRRTVPFGRRAARLLGLKVVAVVAAAATGGLALAASTGVLPTPLHPHATPSHHNPSSRPIPSSAAASRRPGPQPSASLAANIAALCTAYWTADSSQRDKALASPGFAALVAAAGSAEKVPTYCAGRTVGQTPQPRTTPSRHDTGKPTASPSHPATGQEPSLSPAREAP